MKELQVGKGAVDDLLRDVISAPPRFRGLQVIVRRIEFEHRLSYYDITSSEEAANCRVPY